MSSSTWNGTVQHSLRTLNTSPLRSHRSSGHASSPDTRSFRSFVHSPSSPRTSGSSFLKNSSRLHGGVHAGGISLRINGRICYDTNRPCCITAKSRITLLYGAGCWRVAGVMQGISTRMTSRLGTGSGSSSTPLGFGLIAPVRRSSQNRYGGAFFSVLPKLQGRLHTSDQFRKLVELTKHPSRHLEFDDPLL